MDKKINYLARDFSDIKSELLNFSKKYYPELSDSFNDASVGAWFIDLVSSVGDNLSYHTDRMYQENNCNTATVKSSILNYARNNNVKIPGPKASMCEVEFSCVIGVTRENNNNIASPNWSQAPIIKMGSVVGNSSYYFELTEDVDFGSQFNSDGVSNRKFKAIKNNNNNIVQYEVTKTALVYGGKSKIYKKVISQNDVKPFMEVILPDKNIMNIESIIFKEGNEFTDDPQTYEYYIEKEEYYTDYGMNPTHRYFEVDSLSDQYIYRPKMKESIIHPYSADTDVESGYIEHNGSICDMYEDETETPDKKNGSVTESSRSTRYYKGEWRGITQKFITEYTDNGYLKIIFGGGSMPQSMDSQTDATIYGRSVMSRIINNEYLGMLPSIGWTMYVLYRVGGGTETNLAKGAINSLVNISTVFPKYIDASEKTKVINSIKVSNLSPSIGGKNMLDEEETKFFIKYATSSQDRCVTLKDYKTRIMMIPPKYGCPFRCNAIEKNNKINIACLCIDGLGKLSAGLPNLMSRNIVNYLTHYKNLGDYVELTSGKIYNLAFEIDVFINKNYIPADVIKRIIDTVYRYMSVSKHDMGESIFVGDLNKEINMIDGVVSLIEMRIYNIYGGKYNPYISPLPKKMVYNIEKCKYTSDGFFNNENSSFQIDLNEIDSVLVGEYDSMYEILDPNTDIIVKTKLK